MPSITGGDNTDKDYAPHMWVGDHFVGNATKRLQIGDYWYRFANNSEEVLVAERWPASQGEYGTHSPEMVPEEEIPQEVRGAISPTAYADRVQEIRDLVSMIDPDAKIDERGRSILP